MKEHDDGYSNEQGWRGYRKKGNVINKQAKTKTWSYCITVSKGSNRCRGLKAEETEEWED